MVHIIWEFKVALGKGREFERHYGSAGTWAQFFRQGAGFQQTLLLRAPETGDRYLTVDVWDKLASFEAFKEKFAARYAEIDRQMEALTEEERKIGIFEQV